MSAPHPHSAYLLDTLVTQLRLWEQADDAALAAREFSLAVPEATRGLDLCFGAAPVEPFTTDNPFATITLGQGVERAADGKVYTLPTNLASLPGKVYEYALSPEDSFSASEPLRDVYAFGSVFVCSYTQSSTHANSIQANVLRGAGGGGSPLFMTRELPLNTVLQWVRQGAIPAAAAPTPSVGQTNWQTLEIARFVLDIDYFDANAPQRTRMRAHLHDRRRLRGYLGYSEETMASVLTPNVIAYREDSASALKAVSEAVKQLVFAWVHLPSWQPSFLGYWQEVQTLPPNLTEYLLEEFGINV